MRACRTAHFSTGFKARSLTPARAFDSAGAGHNGRHAVEKNQGGRGNQLHFGDNLVVLRSGAIPPESVDLIYLDPPFNSNASYNMLFVEPEGLKSQAQIEAFEDTWQWGIEAEEACDDILDGANQKLGKLIYALRETLGDNSMMAYVAMMAVRLVELHRVLKKTGSLYLHCDPTASHYLKMVLDAVFGIANFRSEIIWQRTSAKGDVKNKFGAVHDSILFYAKSPSTPMQSVFAAKDEAYLGRFKLDDKDGRGPYRLAPLDSPNLRPNLVYKYREFSPPSKGWRVSREVMEHLDSEGRLAFPRTSGGRIARKHYLSEQEGRKVGDVWTDIPPLQAASVERLGYPTQKPLALLERIIAASSAPGDVVLDPFCGCGTAVHGAQRLGRVWIGIDVTHLAVSLIESRLVSAFPTIQYELFGTPKDVAGARSLAARNKHQFELWALSLVKAQPGNDRKKGADHGIDGLLWLRIGHRERAKVIVSVKGGFNVSVPMVRDLVGVIEREKAAIGLFVTMHPPTGPMKAEAAKAGFYQCDGERYSRIQILTIEELLAGKRADLPLIDHAALTRQAPIDQHRTTQHSLL